MAAPAIWGDGFVEDGIIDIAAVRSWDAVTPDEHVLMFPNLIPRDGRLPPVLLARLEACVAVRAWRILERDPGGPAPRWRPTSSPDLVAKRRLNDAWFCDRTGLAAAVLHRVGFISQAAPGRVVAERSLLNFLEGTLADVKQGRTPFHDDEAEVLLAFGAGMHPAYMWPSAAGSHARGLAAGWLGHLDRGRAALMPGAVAEYIVEALAGTPPIDAFLAQLVRDAVPLSELKGAAYRRIGGKIEVVRPGSRRFAYGDLPIRRRARPTAAGASA